MTKPKDALDAANLLEWVKGRAEHEAAEAEECRDDEDAENHGYAEHAFEEVAEYIARESTTATSALIELGFEPVVDIPDDDRGPPSGELRRVWSHGIFQGRLDLELEQLAERQISEIEAEREDRIEPPPWYLVEDTPTALAKAWWGPYSDDQAAHYPAESHESAVAACWKHRDAVLASAHSSAGATQREDAGTLASGSSEPTPPASLGVAAGGGLSDVRATLIRAYEHTTNAIQKLTKLEESHSAAEGRIRELERDLDGDRHVANIIAPDVGLDDGRARRRYSGQDEEDEGQQ